MKGGLFGERDKNKSERFIHAQAAPAGSCTQENAALQCEIKSADQQIDELVCRL